MDAEFDEAVIHTDLTPAEARLITRTLGKVLLPEQIRWGYQGADEHTRIYTRDEGDYLLQVSGPDEGRIEFYGETGCYAAPGEADWMRF